MKNILERYKINSKNLISYNNEVFKLKPSFNFSLKNNSQLILITSTNPTPYGEGKTTIAIELADALTKINKKPFLCLRQPSIGPTLGLKGGATGFGNFQIVPQDLINLGLTGDLFVIETINNLIASVIDNELYFDNKLGIDPNKIVWKRVIDISDRGLRDIKINLKQSLEYKTGFDITAASEIMAILCLAKNMDDFVNRINNIVVAYSKNNKPIYVKSFHIEKTIQKLANRLLWPNLVKTKNNSLCLIHGGPFANIAHGCNSIIALNTARQYAKIVITEAGFGADLGAEKFIDIVGQLYYQPNLVLICTSIKSLLYHGNENIDDDTKKLLSGITTLEQNIKGLKSLNINPCVVLNQFANDDLELIKILKNWCNNKNIDFIVMNPTSDKDASLKYIGKKIISLLNKNKTSVKPLYKLSDKLETKLNKIVKNIYGIDSQIVYSQTAKKQLKELNNLPYFVCFAKTPLSLSSDAKQLEYNPKAQIKIEFFTIATGAKFIIPICGNIYRMPGLPKNPNAQK